MQSLASQTKKLGEANPVMTESITTSSLVGPGGGVFNAAVVPRPNQGMSVALDQIEKIKEVQSMMQQVEATKQNIKTNEATLDQLHQQYNALSPRAQGSMQYQYMQQVIKIENDLKIEKFNLQQLPQRYVQISDNLNQNHQQAMPQVQTNKE
jgi:glucose-6-phosphate 1-dehydrogenase